MTFTSTFKVDFERVDGGETKSRNGSKVLGHRTFEDGLIIGRFAKVDAGSLDNLDGSASPIIAGVVLRSQNATIENGTVIETAFETGAVEYMQDGLVTVFVKAGETPVYKGTVYASNAGDADDGLAQAIATNGVDTGAVFIEEVKAGVWLIDQK